MATVDQALWQGIIEKVIRDGGNIIRSWFTDLEPLSLEHGLLEILVPGPTEQAYCNRHASRLFTQAAQSATGRLVGVCFLTRAQTTPVSAGNDTPAADTSFQAAAEEAYAFCPDYTFDSFVTGPCNRLAHAACQAISESPGVTYNPLFLHGAVGLGKTHLLHATCQTVLNSAPGRQISILSCESFVNHFIEAVERGKLMEFRYRYRHVDVLAIDDIQFLADHEQSQEEFFHTFNTLYQAHKQIILSGDRGPSDLANLEERLISRFNWGLVARIDPPGYETRVAIVRKKVRARGIELPEDVACFIAGKIECNTRELEGAIAKVSMLAKVSDRPIDLAIAEEALGAEPSMSQSEVSIQNILQAVTGRYQVRLADLQSKKRSRSISLPRQVCMYLARNLTRHSLEEIGGYFGGRDHSTVLHANKTIENLRQSDPHLHATLDLLTNDIRNGQG